MQQPMQNRVSFFFLRELVLFLESTRFIGRLSFTDLYLETSELPQRLMDSLWELVCLPHGYLTPEFLFWTKRLINRLYGQRLPHFLEKHGGTLDSRQTDPTWSGTEAAQAKAAQDRITRQEQAAQQQKRALAAPQSHGLLSGGA